MGRGRDRRRGRGKDKRRDRGRRGVGIGIVVGVGVRAGVKVWVRVSAGIGIGLRVVERAEADGEGKIGIAIEVRELSGMGKRGGVGARGKRKGAKEGPREGEGGAGRAEAKVGEQKRLSENSCKPRQRGNNVYLAQQSPCNSTVRLLWVRPCASGMV